MYCWFYYRNPSLGYTDGMVVIGKSLGGSIQRGRGRGGRRYMDK